MYVESYFLLTFEMNREGEGRHAHELHIYICWQNIPIPFTEMTVFTLV